MKDVVISIDEFTDSREAMTARPKPFTLWLIYLILGLFAAFVLWASLSKMDEYVNVSGTVRPVADTSVVRFPMSGTIKSISVKDGQSVKAGDTLLEINVDTSKSQKAVEEEQLENIQSQINNTNLLISSIQTGKSQFDPSQQSQENYRSKYDDYLKSISVTKTQYESNSLDLVQAKQDAQSTIASADQSIQTDRDTLQDYSTLSDSISSNTNKFASNESMCAKKFASYYAKHTTYQQALSSDQKSLDSAVQSGKSQDSVNTLQTAVNADKSNLETLKQDALADAQAAINQLNSQINELNLTKSKAQDVLTGSASKETGEDAALEKSKLDALSQLDDSLTTLRNNEATLKNQLFDLGQAINNATVKANTNGKISLISTFRTGDLVSAGNEAMSIVPQDAGKQIILYVPESNISHFKVGGQLKYKMDSLPYSEYGEARGTVLSISPDVIADKTSGKSYYIIKGKLDTTVLKNAQGETGTVQTGMNCQAKMIYGTKSILSWLLEKLHFIDL